MVLVLGWARQRNWVRIVTVGTCSNSFYIQLIVRKIISTISPTVERRHYLPIYPTKKSRETRIQLKLCNDWDMWTELAKR